MHHLFQLQNVSLTLTELCKHSSFLLQAHIFPEIKSRLQITKDGLWFAILNGPHCFQHRQMGWIYLLFFFVHLFNYFTLLWANRVGTEAVLLPAWCDRQLPLQSQHLLLRLSKEPLTFHFAWWKREALQRQTAQLYDSFIKYVPYFF